MNAEQFCYWLKGIVEVSPRGSSPTPEQWAVVSRRLNEVIPTPGEVVIEISATGVIDLRAPMVTMTGDIVDADESTRQKYIDACSAYYRHRGRLFFDVMPRATLVDWYTSIPISERI